MEHCGRRDMAPIPSALAIVRRHCGEGSRVLKWFDGMKSGVGPEEPRRGTLLPGAGKSSRPYYPKTTAT
jgi:hypothetical protein